MNWIYTLLNRPVKSKVFYGIMLIFPLILISSCTKDVLDKVPTDRFSDEAVWKDENLIQAFINDTYRELPTGNKRASRGLRGVTDEVYRGAGSNNFINAGNITPSQLGILNYWNNTEVGFNY